MFGTPFFCSSPENQRQCFEGSEQLDVIQLSTPLCPATEAFGKPKAIKCCHILPFSIYWQ
jgi:hypothetical protein